MIIVSKNHISKTLERLRKEHDFTKDYVGNYLNSKAKFHPSSVYNTVIDPKNTKVDIEVLKKLADLYKKDISIFFSKEDVPSKSDPLMEIEHGLECLGFNSETVNFHVKQIKAWKALGQ